MSVNYYVHTPDGEEIHLGKARAGNFLFRAHPDRDVMSYASWLGLLEQGVICSESGVVYSPGEMVEIAETFDRVRRPHSPGRDQFDDGRYRFMTVDFF